MGKVVLIASQADMVAVWSGVGANPDMATHRRAWQFLARSGLRRRKYFATYPVMRSARTERIEVCRDSVVDRLGSNKRASRYDTAYSGRPAARRPFSVISNEAGYLKGSRRRSSEIVMSGASDRYFASAACASGRRLS